MNAKIESLIVKIINSSDTLKACVEKDEVSGLPQFEWIDAVNPKSKPFLFVTLGLQKYRLIYTDRKIEDSWDETLAEHISDNPNEVIDICLYARTFAETWAALDKMRFGTNGDRDAFDAFSDALVEFAENFR